MAKIEHRDAVAGMLVKYRGWRASPERARLERAVAEEARERLAPQGL